MYARSSLVILGCAAIAGLASAQVEQRRAAIVGGGDRDRGRCTIEVVVDGAAEVEIRGDTGVLRNLAGQPPQWRRFDCSAPMPANPADFRFEGVDGRGRQELVRDPRNNGAAVVRIEDRDGGREGYKFNLFWSGGGFRGDDRYDRGGDRGGFRRMSTEEAVRVCQESVREQAVERFRTREVEFRRTTLDDNPGRNDWVIGTLMVRRGYGREEVYRFSCSVNFDSGRVRSAEIQQLEGGRYGDREEGRGGGAGATSRALANCQQAVEQRIRRDGYDRVEIGTINIDNRPGRNDWIIGNARAFGRGGRDAYEFSCSVDLRDGDIRSVDVRRR